VQPDDLIEHKSSAGVDTVGRLLMAGVATVITAAATFGAVTGNLAFLLRNKGLSMGIALGLAALGAAIAGAVVMWPTRVDRAWMIRAGAFGLSGGLLAVALLLVISTQARLASSGSRPVITVEWDSAGSVPILIVDAEADGLTINDRVFANVLAYPGDPRSVKRHAFVNYYSGFTGPDVNGHAEQRVAVPMPVWSTQEIGGKPVKVPIKSVMVAVIVDKSHTSALITPEKSFGITCEGEVYSSKHGTEVREDRDPIARTTRPACVYLRAITPAMAASAPTPTRTAVATPTATSLTEVTPAPAP
jgi:hypothetical protein